MGSGQDLQAARIEARNRDHCGHIGTIANRCEHSGAIANAFEFVAGNLRRYERRLLRQIGDTYRSYRFVVCGNVIATRQVGV